MRGDANIDFIIAITIFLGFLFFILSNLAPITLQSTPKPGPLEEREYLASSLVLQSLAFQGKMNVLDSRKLESLNCTELGKIVNSSVYVEVNSRLADWKCKNKPNANLPYITRPVYVVINGKLSPGVLKVWVWKEGT